MVTSSYTAGTGHGQPDSRGTTRLTTAAATTAAAAQSKLAADGGSGMPSETPSDAQLAWQCHDTSTRLALKYHDCLV